MDSRHWRSVTVEVRPSSPVIQFISIRSEVLARYPLVIEHSLRLVLVPRKSVRYSPGESEKYENLKQQLSIRWRSEHTTDFYFSPNNRSIVRLWEKALKSCWNSIRPRFSPLINILLYGGRVLSIPCCSGSLLWRFLFGCQIELQRWMTESEPRNPDDNTHTRLVLFTSC